MEHLEVVPRLSRAGSLTVDVAVAADEVAGGLKANPELAMSYCPSCSTRLASRSCKLICPGCGYYMSCSDFY